MEQPKKRLVCTKKAMEAYRSANPTYTDEFIANLVERTYPDVYYDNLEVGMEIFKELYRSQTPLNEENFANLLREYVEQGKFNSYTKAVVNIYKRSNKAEALVNHIYKDAQEKTTYLSQYEEWNDKDVQDYFNELCQQKEKTLAQVLFQSLNNIALKEKDMMSGIVLPFHCYSEPNGDIIFTKDRKTKADYDSNGKPIAKSTTNTSTSNKGSGCIVTILLLIVFGLGLMFI